MVKRRSTLPLSLLIIISFIVPAVALSPPAPHIMDEGISGEHIMIDLGPPVFDVASSYLDGKLWNTIEMEDAIYPPTNGEPSIPVFSYPLQLRNEALDIQLTRSDPVKLPLTEWLPPSPSIAPLTEEFLSSGESTGLLPDTRSYTSDKVFPVEPLLWSSLGHGWKDGERYAHYSISACPFDYEPSRNMLTYYRDVKLKITLGEPEPTMDDLSSEPTRDGTRAASKPLAVKTGTELLIIAYDQFQDDLEPYIEWNMEKGTLVSMVPISTVDNAYSTMDQASSIWQYIHDTFFGDEQNLEYVLLAGEVRYVRSRMAKDLDPYTPAGEPDTLPTDTYYACLDGTYTNWNDDGDSNWAELGDIIDYIPDVYVSRISLDTDTEASNWADLVVNYEKNVPVGNWAGTAGLFGSSTHFVDDGPTQCEYLWEKYLDTAYTTPDRYYSNGNVRTSTGAKHLDYGSIQTGLSDGLSIIVYMGHGNRQFWSEGTHDNNNIIYTLNEANALSQAPKLPFITAMSCETNWFDGTNFESISEGFTENKNGGAIAYIGAVRTTEGGIGYNQYLPGAPGIQEDVLRMIKQGHRRTGEIFHEAKEYYANYFKNYFIPSYEFAYNAYIEHNMLGAPETPIWTVKPDTFKVSYSFNKDHYTNFTVQVLDSGNDPVEDAVVAIYSSTVGKISSVTTRSNGYAMVPYEIPQTAFAKITVTKEDFKPFQEEIVLRDNTPPETEIVTSIPNPNGMNGWFTLDPEPRFSCTEPADIYYRWNMGATTKYKGGIIPVPEGDHLLEFWAVDMSDNDETKKTLRMKYDPEAPVVDVTITPEEPDGESGWYVTAPTITLEMEEGNGAPQEIEYWWGKGSREGSNGTIFPPQGDSELHIQGIDEAGNKGEEFFFNLRVDSIGPTTTTSTGGREPNERGWYTSPITIELQCDDRYSTTYYSWDNMEGWDRYSSDISPLQGNHTLYFYSEDPHGNVEEVRSFVVPFDVMAPELQISTDPRAPDGEEGWFVTVPELILDVFNEDDGHVIYYHIGKGPLSEYTSPISIPDGIRTITCYAEDDAGNRGITQEILIKVDTETESTRTGIDLSPDGEGQYTEVPGITMQTGEGAVIYYSWDGGEMFERYYGMISPPEEEGEFTLFYYSIDEAGNRESQNTMLIPVDAKAPVVSALVPKWADVGEKIRFDLSGTTDGIGVESYFIDFGDGSDSDWVQDPIIEHGYSSGGTYSVIIKAKDGSGHVSEETTLDIVVSEDSSMQLFILFAAVGAGILVIALIIGAALVARSRHHHHHLQHHYVPYHYGPQHQLPHHHGPQQQLPQRAPHQLPPKEQGQRPAPGAIKQVPAPPAAPQLPQPPRPPI
ncbi:MAG: C25 family cysteine peptidase [Candidatus Thermoplasmatota archaeon]|nr:C25 family cysteine peptidase [Candidatus Thermoplasmatota archaeon]